MAESNTVLRKVSSISMSFVIVVISLLSFSNTPPPPPPLFLFHLLGWEASPIAGLTLWAPRSWLYVIAAKEGEEGLSASKVNKITLPREITYHSMTKKGRPSIIKMIYPSGFSPSHTPVLQEVWLRTIPDSRLAEKMYIHLQSPWWNSITLRLSTQL